MNPLIFLCFSPCSGDEEASFQGVMTEQERCFDFCPESSLDPLVSELATWSLSI